MDIDGGEPVVFMGSNGCGKSTLLRIIAGLLHCTTGEVVHLPEIKISYVPDRFPKLPFKVNDYLRHMGRIQKISDGDILKYMRTMFERLNIPEHIETQKIPHCSKGTIQKINIMQALITRPDLLILDEPFSGLDEDTVEVMVELLKNMEETHIVLSCHEKILAQRLAEKVFVFRKGAVVNEVFAY